MTLVTGGEFNGARMVLEVVIPGPWASGNDRFSVWGQEMATPLFRPQPGFKLCYGASGWEGGEGREEGQGKGQARAVQLFTAKTDKTRRQT